MSYLSYLNFSLASFHTLRGANLTIKKIRLINFRNYNNLDIELNDRLNLVIGKNAQGKTNLLESIYISATGDLLEPIG